MTKTMRARAAMKSALKNTGERHSSSVGSVIAVRTVEPVVVLTFDDGPDPEGTESVLGALADHDATATFFVLMTAVRRNPSLTQQIVAAGHEVALHGVDHTALTKLPARDVLQRCRSGRAELEDAIGAPVRWLRPPYGRQSATSWLATRRAGLMPVFWGATTWDWRELPDTDRVTKAMHGATPGTILLAHDGHADQRDGADDGAAPHVDRGALMRQVLRGYADRGLVGRSLAQALSNGTAIRAARFSG